MPERSICPYDLPWCNYTAFAASAEIMIGSTSDGELGLTFLGMPCTWTLHSASCLYLFAPEQDGGARGNYHFSTASIPHFSWHSLMHTFSTLGGNEGSIPTLVMGQLLGHSKLSTNDRYTHELAGPNREAVQKIENLILFSDKKTSGK